MGFSFCLTPDYNGDSNLKWPIVEKKKYYIINTRFLIIHENVQELVFFFQTACQKLVLHHWPESITHPSQCEFSL